MDSLNVVLLPLLRVLSIAIDIYIYLLIAMAILSWLVAFDVINPRNQLVRTVGTFLWRITEPALKPIRRILPNLGGTVPNAIFAETLGLPTVWIPHSYPACSQHAPNEHLLGSVARESLALMAGVWWDLGESGANVTADRRNRIARSSANSP